MLKKRNRNEQGQSTVEFALVIPIIVLFLVIVLQVGLVVEKKVLAGNASREAARILSVANDSDKAKNKVKETLPDAKVDIKRPSKQGEYLSVKVTKIVESQIPILGIILPDITVSSSTTMRVEK